MSPCAAQHFVHSTTFSTAFSAEDFPQAAARAQQAHFMKIWAAVFLQEPQEVVLHQEQKPPSLRRT